MNVSFFSVWLAAKCRGGELCHKQCPRSTSQINWEDGLKKKKISCFGGLKESSLFNRHHTQVNSDNYSGASSLFYILVIPAGFQEGIFVSSFWRMTSCFAERYEVASSPWFFSIAGWGKDLACSNCAISSDITHKNAIRSSSRRLLALYVCKCVCWSCNSALTVLENNSRPLA